MPDSLDFPIHPRVAARPWCIGYSGGLDSSVLLHALAALRPGQVRALHVHHGLHPDADHWALHCERACRALDVPLAIARVTVTETGQGPEAAARAARHAAYEAALGEDEVIALAHHQDDQAETFLLRALRGAGPDGLGAMRPLRRLGQGWLWRPLLEIPRDALLAYARAHGLAWIDDPSNDCTGFDRNYLRAAVMPRLRERWPQASAAFARAARLQRQANEALQAEETLFDATANPLPLESLRALMPSRRAHALRHWAAVQGLPPPPARGIDWLEAELAKPPGDGASECRWEGALLRRWRDAVHPGDGPAPLPADLALAWNGREPLLLPNGLRWTLRGAPAFDAPLRVHARQGGEHIQLPGRAHRHRLKRVLQDAGLPPWQRVALPLLSGADGRLLAAGQIHSAPLAQWLAANDATLRLSGFDRD